MNSSPRSAVVAGAGIVGRVQALLLAKAGFKVTLVDAADSTGVSMVSDDSLSVRSVALSYRSQQLLGSAGLWDNSIGCPITSVLVNEKGRFGSVTFQAAEFSVAALGYVVKNHLLEQHLKNKIYAQPAIEVVQPGSVVVKHSDEHRVSLTINTAQQSTQHEAHLLVAADGTRSSLREQLGIEVKTTDYDQLAVVANVICQRDHGNSAFERFTESGPLALLPLGKQQMAMVYTVDASREEEVKALSDQQLLDEIQHRFGGRLGRFQAVGRRALLPLTLVRCENQFSGCGVLIGNSARTLHPVAGQGLNLALRDAFGLVGMLSHEPNVASALSGFVSARRSDQQFVLRQTDALARVFRKHPWPISASLGVARQSSILLLDTIAPLREKFGRRNAGMGISLPSAGH